MRAAIMDAPYQMHIGTWETPQASHGEVLIAIEATGVCAGDVYVYLGKNPYVQYPQVCGHEIAGRIVALGAGVEQFELNTLVVVEPFLGCGTCYPCRIGKSNCCANLQIIGVHRPGGFAELVVAPATHVHPVPSGVSARDASFAEPIAIAVQACRRGMIQANEDVLILGCGPIGLALIEVIQALGAHVIATDTIPTRLNTAATLGACVLPADDLLLDTILAQTNGEGMPVVIEATGNPQAMQQSVDLVAAGGRIVIVGLVKQGTQVMLPGLDFTRKEMTILGSRASIGCFPEALTLLSSGAITYPQLATNFGMWQAPSVFAQVANDPASVHKAVLMISAALV